MQFDASTVEDTNDDFSPVPAGTYQFVIVDAQETTSKAGNNMLKVELDITGPKHAKRKIWDYIVESAGWKLKMLVESVGMTTFSHESELVGKELTATIEIDGEYNRITRYLKPGSAAKPTQDAPQADTMSDAIPF